MKYEFFFSENLRASVYPDKLIVKEGISVTFTCNVTGPQITSLVWTKNLKPVITSARTKLISSEVLQIYSVQREDKGMYQCFVRSNDHSAQGSAQLTLEGNIIIINVSIFIIIIHSLKPLSTLSNERRNIFRVRLREDITRCFL